MDIHIPMFIVNFVRVTLYFFVLSLAVIGLIALLHFREDILTINREARKDKND